MLFVIAVFIGAIAGALVTAVWFLDHPHKEKKRRWWE
jgi:NADH:ubiquinone oxidoreductase subunit 6 (subunit J)